MIKMFDTFDIIGKFILANYYYFPGTIVMLYSLRYRIRISDGWWGYDINEKGYYYILVGIILIVIGHFIKLVINQP